GAGMQQNGLHLAGRERVAGGDVDRERLVPAVHEFRPGLALLGLLGHRLPDRGPFGARGRQDVLHPEIPDAFEDGVAAVERVLHVSVTPLSSLTAAPMMADRAYPYPSPRPLCASSRSCRLVRPRSLPV